MTQRKRCYLIRYAEKLYDLLLRDLVHYGYFDVIRIFEEYGYLYVHVITEDRYNLTVVYYYTGDEMYPYQYVGLEYGFIKRRQQQQPQEEYRMTTREKMWLKRDFDRDAYKCYAMMSYYDDFSHLLYSLDECGGYYCIKILVNNNVSSEFKKLFRCGRLDLSLENLALQKKYQSLFTREELEICYNRLHYYMNLYYQINYYDNNYEANTTQYYCNYYNPEDNNQ